jgi:FlaA1/EpsC-like NDP-sugar epimerase
VNDSRPYRLALRGRHLILFDATATVVSFVLSLALRFDAPSADFLKYLIAFLWVIPLLLAVRLGAFLVLGLYQRVWRYASVDELIAVLIAVGASSLVGYGLLYAVVLLTPISALGFPRSVAVIDTTFVIAFAGAWRFALRMGRVGRAGTAIGGAAGKECLVVGSGAAAIQVLRELRSNPSLGFRPVGVLTDEIPIGHRLLGNRVIGTTASLAAQIRATRTRTVLLALPEVEGRVLRRLVREAEAEGAQCLTVPSVAEVVAGRVSVNALREVELEDLLRRSPARIDLDSVADSFSGRCVLITGAGGSIGGELARQLIRFRPRQVVLLGRGENSIFETMHSIRPDSAVAVTPVILDIRERDRLLRLFRSIRPDVVFHAAAHKHLSFMEQFPEEAVAVNVVGTANVIDSAIAGGVERFVFISTDKAVNPTSVMGATKRIGELLVRQVAREEKVRYVSVRFGNVLSSRGSVVPLFRQQLARGGPITITHPDAMRFFMTIPEAVQLVLQAAALASPGDTFVLDMGDPVRILELARELIKLHGLRPDDDIAVEFIGPRPGEKLVEELYLASERAEPTTHEAIRRVPLNGATADIRSTIARLEATAQADGREQIVERLQEIVPEYRPGGEADIGASTEHGAEEGQASS